ncbi:MAG: hypothetical protein K0Q94_5113 [Paenibacillus sp.]|jgi:hypothetical protein|uniref:hypothetical protein n=1 Tax=Paenibacillus sp. GCM10012303 TaxID=3317340 RepID=UPI0029F4454D|nr:hypothetical protein [Paenibacillus sp.]
MNVSHTVSCTMTSVKRHDYPITRGDLRRSAAMKRQSLFQELLYTLQEEMDRYVSSDCPAIQRTVDYMERSYM